MNKIKLLFENYEVLGMSFINQPGSTWEASQELLTNNKYKIDITSVLEMYSLITKTDNLQY